MNSLHFNYLRTSHYVNWFGAMVMLVPLTIVINGIGLLDWLTGGFSAQNFYLLSAPLLVVYWTISIFIFLFKQVDYTLFTSVLQSYWKRALYLFWGLELFLFSIYIFLVLNSPVEVEWLLDQPQLFLNHNTLSSVWFIKLSWLLLAIFLVQLLTFSSAMGSRIITFLGLLALVYIVGCVLYGDFYVTYAATTVYFNIRWVFDYDFGCWEFTFDINKFRTHTHYVFLVSVLKFWHTVFIMVFLLVTTMFYLYMPNHYYGGIAANNQNLFFLYGFAFLNVVGLVKFYNSVAYEAVYGWFYLNPFILDLGNITPLSYWL